MFEDFFPIYYLTLNFIEIERAHWDLFTPVKFTTFRLKVLELLIIEFFNLIGGGGGKLTDRNFGFIVHLHNST